MIELPCAAAHRFHRACAINCLSRSVFCPLCRVNVKRALPSSPRSSPPPPLSPRQLGFTRDGGMILRYEQNPSADVARPAYIPPDMHERAEFVEIQYAEQGVARIWYGAIFWPSRYTSRELGCLALCIVSVRSCSTRSVGAHSALSSLGLSFACACLSEHCPLTACRRLPRDRR